MASHIKILGVLHVVFSSLGVIAAIVVVGFFGTLIGVVGSSGSDDASAAMPIAGGLAGIIAIVILMISLPGLIGGIGLLKGASWSRILMIVISCLNLLSLPFGTALGIYGLWVLTKPETRALLEGTSSRAAAY